MAQEQEEVGICRWVTDAAASLLKAPLVSMSLNPAKHNGPKAVYGNLRDSPLPSAMIADLAKLAEMEWPSPHRSGSVAVLPAEELPASLTGIGIGRLARMNVRKIQQNLGVLMVGWDDPQEIGSREQFVFGTLANQAAVALDNTRLRKESNQRAERLASFNRIIQAISSSLDLPGVFRLLSSEAQALVAHDWASVALADPDGQAATVYGVAGQAATLGSGTVVPIAGSMVGRVISTSQGYFNTDLEQSEAGLVERQGLLAMGIRSNVMVPLRDGDICFGSLNFGSFQVGSYGPDELALAQEIADKVAVAIINARLHEALQETNETLRTLIQASPLAVIVRDPDAKVQIWNPAAERIFGWSEQEILGNPYPLVPEDKQEEFRANLEGSLRGEALSGLETRRLNKDGTLIDVGIWTGPLGDGGAIVIVADITDRKRAQEVLLQQMKELAVLDERNRLAREIHDTLAQEFTAIIWQVNAAERTVEGGGKQAAQSLERVRDLAREGLAEARRSVWDLRAGPLGGRTLAEVLQQEMEKVTKGGDIQTSFNMSGEERVLLPGLEAAFLRICQESLANILKHANATEVTVTLAFDDSQVRLAIRDNGVGFDSATPRARDRESGGFGLINMRERARLLGGELTAQSEPGQGTLVEAILPLK